MTSLAERTSTAPPPSRRGPMRPRRLVSVRANRGRGLSSQAFRVTDLAAIIVTTLTVLVASSPVALLADPLTRVLPLTVGALVLARMLRSLCLYRFLRSDGLPLHLARLSVAIGIALAAQLLVDALTPSPARTGTDVGEVALTWTAVTGGAVVALHVGWWLIARSWRRAGWLTPNLVVVGATAYAEAVIRDALEHRHVNVIGVFDDRLERSPDAILGVPVLGDLNALLEHRITPFVDRIVIAVEPQPTQRVLDIAARLGRLPNDITFFLAEDGSAGRVTALDRLGDTPLGGGSPADTDRKAFAKRVQDLAVGVPVLVLASPLLLLLAALVKLDSRGPVFFRQHRHGFNNEDIVVWKFRSMFTDAADQRAARQVVAGDERVTRVGRFLRRTSLDELPQLLNVIHGEMALVGPRPHAIGMMTGQVESVRLVAGYAHRHRIKPGMTGWAAVHGSRGPLHTPADVQRRVNLDVDYIARQSLLLDLWIMARTLPTLLGDRHAAR